MLSEILVVVVAEAASPPFFYYAFSLSFFSPYEVWYGRFDLIYLLLLFRTRLSFPAKLFSCQAQFGKQLIFTFSFMWFLLCYLILTSTKPKHFDILLL